MIYGYARVSTGGQSFDGQVEELTAAGCERVVAEVASSQRKDRMRLRQLLNGLQEGDVLMVTRLDRLARSTRDLLNILEQVSQAGAGFRSLRDHWANTGDPHGRLLTAVLGSLAEFERELLLARTGEGRKAARVRGVKFGRRYALSREQRAWVAIQRRDTDISCRELGRVLNVHWSTISRISPAGPGDPRPAWSPSKTD